MAHRLRIVIQARMGSGRLPGKSLADLAGRPLLVRVVERCRAAGRLSDEPWQITVATSGTAPDDEIAGLCRRMDVACFRGSPDDVLDRYLAATADLDDADTVVRVTADNPLYCPRRTVAIVAVHRALAADYTCVEDLSYVVPEVIQTAALRSMASRQDIDEYCREHVTPFFRRRGVPYRVVQMPPTWQGLRPGLRLTIDTAEELEHLRQAYRSVTVEDPELRLESIYRWCDRRSRVLAAA